MGLTQQPTVSFNANSAMNEQQFTSSGTYTPATGVNKIQVLIVSGGGSGSKSTNGYQGVGGEGGAQTTTQLTVTPLTSYTVTVGAGGAAPSSNGAVGGQGSSSVFGSTTITGGLGGGFSSTGNQNLTGFVGASSYGVGSGAGGSGAANTGGGGGGGYGSNAGGSGIVIVRWLA